MMRPSTKTIAMFFLLVTLVAFGQLMIVHSENLSLQDRALDYVKNVLPFDMNRYSIIPDRAYSLGSPPDDPTAWEVVTFNLISGESKIHVVCLHENGFLLQCGVTVLEGSAISDKSYANMAQVAARILEKHQEFVGIDSTTLITMLSWVDETKTMNVTYNDINLSVSTLRVPTSMKIVNGTPHLDFSSTINSTIFSWKYSYNGAPYHFVTLTFKNGVFSDLRDNRAAHPIGNTNVELTKEQAINNAVAYLANYTNKFNLTISNATATLGSYPRNYSELYPFWQVNINFNQNVHEVNVKVWADNGEVFECYQGGSPLGMDELDLKSEPTPTPEVTNHQETLASPTATPPSGSEVLSPSTSTIHPNATVSESDQMQYTLLIVITAVSANVIVVIAIVNFRNKSKKSAIYSS